MGLGYLKASIGAELACNVGLPWGIMIDLK
jgi:hypothetical protein